MNVYNHWGDHVHLTRHGPVGRGEVGRRVGGGDVYAGRDGRVYRRDGGGHWQEYNRGRGWEGLSGPAAEHERSHQARETGQQRLDSLNGHGLAHGLTGGPPHGGGGAHGFAGGMHGGGGAHGGGGGHR